MSKQIVVIRMSKLFDIDTNEEKETSIKKISEKLEEDYIPIIIFGENETNKTEIEIIK